MTELSLFAAAAEEPSHPCLVADGHAWSFEKVAARVRVAIDSLTAAGVSSGDSVACTPDVDVDSLVWLYALFELGCPVVLLHPRLTDRERKVLLGQARPSHVIQAGAPEATISRGDALAAPAPADRTLAVVYTSGTRGTPRGARLSRSAFVASAAAHTQNLGWRSEDRWLLCMPPAHVGGLSIITRSLIARRAVVLSPGPFEPGEVMRLMDDERVTLLSVVPTMLRRMLAANDPSWTPNEELRAVLVGGAPMPESLRRRAQDRAVPVLATYGCTEACSQVTSQSAEQSGSAGSGAPLAGIEVRVHDGEIQVRGAVLMDGYVGEDRSGEPWAPDGWLRTGDFGAFLPDGQLIVRGRLDDLIVTGGENVAPLEIEAWLETVPGVAAACVFSQPSDEWGQEVVAALVTEEARFSVDAFRKQLQAELAPHKRPKRICLLDSLPMNRSGKVDRRVLEADSAQHLRPI